MKIVDAQGVLSRLAPGELLTRGYCVMQGYWNDPERTAEAIDVAGWMHTGDLATLDAEGYATLSGASRIWSFAAVRTSIRARSKNFSSASQDPDVQVFGVPDARYGEELCAWIRLREGVTATPDELEEFCRGQIAHYKIPRYIKFVEAFPMTVTGKIQKFVMRQQTMAELNLQEARTA